jgi:hypothetical protein
MQIRTYQQGDVDRIKEIYALAFKQPPWTQEPTDKQSVSARWQKSAARLGFKCFVAESDNRVIGALWFDTPSDADFIAENRKELVEYIRFRYQASAIHYIRETIVDPVFKKKGAAQLLKAYVLADVAQSDPGAIVCTCMRDDNPGIIRVNLKFGFVRTGVFKPSGTTPGITYEYWCLPIANYKEPG